MTGPKLEIPFQPIRTPLYSSEELLSGYDPGIPESMAETLDFRTYRYYFANGQSNTQDPYVGMMEALHDNSILRAMTVYLAQSKKPAVAIMGGHSEKRDTDSFANVAKVSRQLTRQGCLVASGGGPGMMEATHLGALLVNAEDADLKAALDQLKTQPTLPNTRDVVSDEGVVNMEEVRSLHAWVKPAYQISLQYRGRGGDSLAVPTWYYGSEPISPLATRVAKYFQNSIREDVLLSMAANGIIFTPGAAGTLQEVFQHAAQVFYRPPNTPLTPLIFFGKDFWTNTLPIQPLLHALFVTLPPGNTKEAEFQKVVAVVDTVDDAVNKLLQHAPSKEKTEARMVALGFNSMMESVASDSIQ